jgi:nucleoside-diphosphate-sugar epimerase
VSKLRSIFPSVSSASPTEQQLEIVEIPGLTSDYTSALKDVQAVIHTASPLYQSGISGEEIFQGAYHGTLHIVKQAIEAGVKKIVVTGTYASLYDCEYS